MKDLGKNILFRIQNFIEIFNIELLIKQQQQKRYDPAKADQKIDEIECLNILLNYTELRDPNWLEIHNYVNFTSTQLLKLENVLPT